MKTVKALLGLCLASALFITGCGRQETENSAVVPQSTADTTVKGDDATKKPIENTDGVISKDEAKAAALSHAEVSEDNIQRYKSHLEYEDGVQVYEIEFTSAGYDYDYEIDAKTGDILTFDKEPT